MFTKRIDRLFIENAAFDGGQNGSRERTKRMSRYWKRVTVLGCNVCGQISYVAFQNLARFGAGQRFIESHFRLFDLEISIAGYTRFSASARCKVRVPSLAFSEP